MSVVMSGPCHLLSGPGSAAGCRGWVAFQAVQGVQHRPALLWAGRAPC